MQISTRHLLSASIYRWSGGYWFPKVIHDSVIAWVYCMHIVATNMCVRLVVGHIARISGW